MKILYMLILLLLTACRHNPTIKGNEYSMVTPEGLTITLGFDAHENRYFGKAVNQYFGSYTIDGKQITFSPVGSTMMMGPEEDMTREAKYFDELLQVKEYTLSHDEMTLILENQTKLTFKKNQDIK